MADTFTFEKTPANVKMMGWAWVNGSQRPIVKVEDGGEVCRVTMSRGRQAIIASAQIINLPEGEDTVVHWRRKGRVLKRVKKSMRRRSKIDGSATRWYGGTMVDLPDSFYYGDYPLSTEVQGVREEVTDMIYGRSGWGGYGGGLYDDEIMYLGLGANTDIEVVCPHCGEKRTVSWMVVDYITGCVDCMIKTRLKRLKRLRVPNRADTCLTTGQAGG